MLEDNDKTIGVVSGVLGIRWFDCTVTGMEAHAGPTPMALRKDAMLAATRIMQDVVAAAHRHPPHGRGTVGMVQVFPNSRNVIPGRVKFSIDLRNSTDALVDAMAAEVKAFADQVAKEHGVQVHIEMVSSYPAQLFQPECVEAVGRAAAKLGYSHMLAVSGAGHDAGVHGQARAQRHDLHPLQGWHQPQRDRGRQARAHRGGVQRAAACDAGARGNLIARAVGRRARRVRVALYLPGLCIFLFSAKRAVP